MRSYRIRSLAHRRPTSMPLPRLVPSSTRRLAASAALAVLGLSLACGGGTSEPVRTPTTLAIASSATLTGEVGTELAVAPSVVVRDQSGNPLGGVPLTITVTSGGATITNAATTSQGGPTPIGTVRLGTTAGPQTITIASPGLASIVITIQATPGPAAALVIVSGNNQSVKAGTRLGPVQLAVTDRFGNRVASTTPVTFEVREGGGTLVTTTATPDASGIITVPGFDVGKSVTPQLIRASQGTFSIDISATVESSYTLEVRFFGGTMTAEQQTLFTNAAARVRAIITGALRPVGAQNINLADFCETPGLPTLNETIRGVIIYASIQPIDGPGKILAQAGPCAVRDSTDRNLPAVGIMQFDSADLPALADGSRLQDVITHEMLHVVGFGTLWFTPNNLVAKSDTTNPRYTGAGGIQGCREVGGTTTCAATVPLEGTGGPGTRDSHWRESVFDSELMTGFVERTGLMPLSVMSVRSLGDLGYTVNPPAADPYTIAIGSLRDAPSGAGPADAPWERALLGPGVTLGANGIARRGAPGVRFRAPSAR